MFNKILRDKEEFYEICSFRYLCFIVLPVDEYGIVKRQFKSLCDSDKKRLRKEYNEYKKED